MFFTEKVFMNGNQSVLNRLRLGKIIKNQASLGLNH